MPRVHFLNVLEGDCNIIQHENGHVTVMDVSNAYDEEWTLQELLVQRSLERKLMEARNYVPEGKVDFHQKKDPDNPIKYLESYGIKSVFRFIVSHPDMDHLDGIKDFYQKFKPINTWDTENVKDLSGESSGKYNGDDWKFYDALRAGKVSYTKRLVLHSGNNGDFYSADHLRILSPTPTLVQAANHSGDFNELSYAILYTPPKPNGGVWKILFAGDGCDRTWEHILQQHSALVTNIDVLLAPHHGRGSNRDFNFLKTLNPTVTLMGNASSTHLAYSNYPETRITNNQAGYVILDIDDDGLHIYVKNKEFANWFRTKQKRNWGQTTYNAEINAYFLAVIKP